MESIALDMEDIFDEQANEDDFPSVGPLPDLPGEDDEIGSTQAREDEETNAEVLSRLKDLSKGAAKQVVRRPQPKLDAARLTGDRGIPVLPKVFQDVKFKGKGQEAHDLQIIMRYLEHWAHRLFPKMPFDEVLERIERLGTKNEVKTCIKKMRLDMPVLSDDFVQRSDDEAEDIPNMNGDNVAVNPDDNDAEEAWDEMIREEEERNKTGQGTNTSQLATQLSLPLSQTPSTPTGHLQNGTSPSKVLTPEQIERMERNKLQALARRAERNSNTFKTPAIPKSPGRRVVSHGSSPQSKGSHGISGVCTSTHSQHTSSSCSLQSSSPGELTSQGSTQANATERSQPTFFSLLTSNNTGPEGDEEFSEVIPMMGLPVAATTQALGGHHFSNHVDSKINGDINECRSSVDQNRLPDLQDSNMSEVFPIVQGVPNQNCNTFNPSSGPSEHDSVSSPKKLKTDLNVSSGSFDQVSEDDLRLHLSESD